MKNPKVIEWVVCPVKKYYREIFFINFDGCVCGQLLISMDDQVADIRSFFATSNESDTTDSASSQQQSTDSLCSRRSSSSSARRGQLRILDTPIVK